MLSAAVRRGLKTPLLVGDLPFGSYEASDAQAIAHRAPVRQGGGLRRGQARGRRRDGRARARDRARRRPGHGPRRPDAADGDRARRLPRPGPHGRARQGGARGRARAPGGGLLRDRLRGDPERGHRRDHGVHGGPGHRHRRRAEHRRPGARRCTTCSASTRASSRSSSRSTRRSARRDGPRACGVRRGGPHARLPRPEHGYSIAPEELERLQQRSRGGPQRRPHVVHKSFTYTAAAMARAGHQLFAPKEREFFDLFEEAGANIVRAAALLERMLDQWPDHGELVPRAWSSASRRVTGSPTTSSSG